MEVRDLCLIVGTCEGVLSGKGGVAPSSQEKAKNLLSDSLDQLQAQVDGLKPKGKKKQEAKTDESEG